MCRSKTGGWPFVRPDKFVTRTRYSGDLSQPLQKKKVIVNISSDDLFSTTALYLLKKRMYSVCDLLMTKNKM